MPSAPNSAALRFATVWPRAMRANMPPSPLLSALSSSSTYFTVTTRVMLQKISDRTPSVASAAVSPRCVAAVMASLNA